jgi:3-hydroxyacyl-CoA dehydrogenase
MAMGPNAVSDLSGLDVLEKVRTEWTERPDDPVFFRMITKLVEQGRMGQKSGAGIYKYDGRNAASDPLVSELARTEAAALGVDQFEVSNEEIIERLFYSMINEGALILEEGIALRPGDIDVVYANGYGMPRYRGGPMCYADTVGLKNVRDAMLKYRERYGDLYWTPAPLLEKLADSGKSFDQWSRDRG